jgi:hypothetical protein
VRCRERLGGSITTKTLLDPTSALATFVGHKSCANTRLPDRTVKLRCRAPNLSLRLMEAPD